MEPPQARIARPGRSISTSEELFAEHSQGDRRLDHRVFHQPAKVHETAVLIFARNADVAFTNNPAERDLRTSKIEQKVSGCFREAEFAQAYCRISSYLQTMTNQGVNPLVAIQMALSGQLYVEPGLVVTK